LYSTVKNLKELRQWQKYFDSLAKESETHKRISMKNPWGPNASYTIVERHLNGKVLDVGCGSGELEKRNPHIDTIGVDISINQLKNAKKYCTTILQANATRLPFKDESFDTAVAIGVIQNSGYPAESIIKELCRVSKKKIIITGLSNRKTVQDPRSVYHDPNQLLQTFSQIVGNARCEWGAIKYNRETVWTEDWNKPDNGTIYISVEKIK